MTRPFFSRDRVSDFDIFEKHAGDAISQLKVRLREGYPVDFQDMVSRFTLDSATEFLLGQDVCSLSAGLVYPPSSPFSKDLNIFHHPANQFAHAFHEAQVCTAPRSSFGLLWRVREFWEDKVKKHMKVCYGFIDPILKEALEKKNRMKNNGSLTGSPQPMAAQEGDTLLDHLVKISDGELYRSWWSLVCELTPRRPCSHQRRNHKYHACRSRYSKWLHSTIVSGVKNESFSFETATTLTFLVYMLSQNPDVMHRLREEILRTIGPSRRPTHEDMRDMKYLRAVINGHFISFPKCDMLNLVCRNASPLSTCVSVFNVSFTTVLTCCPAPSTWG